MDAWGTELISDGFNVVLGWALGFGSAALADWRRGLRQLKATRTAISLELQEIAYTLAMHAYTSERQAGRLSRELLEWMQLQIEKYPGRSPKDSLRGEVAGLLAQSDEVLADVAARAKGTPARGQFAPSVEAHYTAATIGEFHELDSRFAVCVLDVLSNLRIFNETRENGLYYSRLTFAPGLTHHNHQLAVENAHQADEMAGRRARIIVDKIAALETEFPPQRSRGWLTARKKT